MNLSEDLKRKIVAALIERRRNFEGSDSRFSVTLGISASQYSRITKGDTDKVLSDANWLSIARKIDVQLRDLPEWKVAHTPVYDFISAQLKMCQEKSMSLLLCDIADIGKTFTAKDYCKRVSNAVYVDCSQVKNKHRLVRYIAKEFGAGHTGTYADVYADLVFYLRSLPQPLVILDEAGDLDTNAFLELKALWNATENCCGWYMMGADGLKEKIVRSINFKKVGYTELYSRYGGKFQKVSPDNAQDNDNFRMASAAIVAKVNMPEVGNIKDIVARSNGSLRRVYQLLNAEV
jgi:hypothetical protein